MLHVYLFVCIREVNDCMLFGAGGWFRYINGFYEVIARYLFYCHVNIIATAALHHSSTMSNKVNGELFEII